jgi:hypothetical protein
MLVGPDDSAASQPLALPLSALESSNAPTHSLPLSQGLLGGRSGCCVSSRSPEPASLRDLPGCHHGDASSLQVLPALEPRGPGGSSCGTNRSTSSRRPEAVLRHPPVHREGMVYYPSTRRPSAGQAGQEHGSGFNNDYYLYEQNQHASTPCTTTRALRRRWWTTTGRGTTPPPSSCPSLVPALDRTTT